MKKSTVKTALVTGANRGIGFEVSRQLGLMGLRIVLTGRDAQAAEEAAELLAKEGISVLPERMEVSDRESVQHCANRLLKGKLQIDVLVNNAGTFPPEKLLGMKEEILRNAMDINFFGAVWTAQAFVPGMLRRGYGRVVNVSSGYGSFAEGLEGPPAYSMSKAALNALTVRLAAEVCGDVKVNSACPGWVRTRMGGAGAPRTVEQGANTIVWLATLPAKGPSGGFFRDRKRIEW